MKQTSTILDQIIETKKQEIAEASKLKSLDDLKNSLSQRKTEIRDFHQALKSKDRVSLVAEIKKASPSEGIIRPDFDHIEIAKIYQDSGIVNAISVLTDEQYFQGKLSYLTEIKDVTKIPILRKDFIFSEYQIYESYLAEADAILFIVAVLELQELKNLLSIADLLGLHCLVEAHTKEELEIAIQSGARIIGINSRDLKTFKLNLDLFSELISQIPINVVRVAESGLKTSEDLKRVQQLGYNAVLVGTSIMKSSNITESLKELKNI